MSTSAIFFVSGCLLSVAACSTGSDTPQGDAGGAAGNGVAGTSSAGASGGSAAAGSAGTSGANHGNGGAQAGATAGGQAGAAPVISGQPAPGSVFVHLFEWKWTDIAAECENYLGPAGFAAVQVSPPSEHALLATYPWYQRYQTVNYSLAQSRSGTAAEFADMVQRCARVGVGIYVDAVINHTTAGNGANLGSNGTRFSKYSYPNLYSASDFHQPSCAIADADYVDSADHVRRCELAGLADLNTGSDAVQGKIADYLSSLVDLGVAGFRIDAAKHMAPEDIDGILGRVNQHAAGHLPFVFLEVIDNGSEAIHASDYLTVGASSGQAVSITDFQYANEFDRFLDYAGRTLSLFKTLSASTGNALPSAQAVVFTTNHDTERHNVVINYQNGVQYDLATVLLLASPYGYPSLLSSYAFPQTDLGENIGPPSDSMGHTNSIYSPGASTPNCAPDPHNPPPGSWVCQHRSSFVAPMLAFRKATVGAETVTNFWDNGKDQIAFGRGAKGFVVINDEGTALSQAFSTGLPKGSYCDVLQGGLNAGACVGASISVNAAGMAKISAPAFSAVVIHVGQMLATAP